MLKNYKKISKKVTVQIELFLQDCVIIVVDFLSILNEASCLEE